MGFGVAVGTAVGAAVGAAVGLAVGAAVGAAVGLVVLPEGLLLEVLELLGFAVAAGFGVAVAEGFTAVLPEPGFAVALGLLAVLLSVLLSGFGVAVGFAVAAAPAEGVAVGFALAAVELVLETGLLLASDVLLSLSFSDIALFTALDAELSAAVFSAVLLPAHAASDNVSAAAIKIAVIFLFIVFTPYLV